MNLFSLLLGKPNAPHIEAGRRGERLAARFLRRLGYTVLQRNVHIGAKDEIDIVAYDPEDDVIVFAEVKTRSEESEYLPELNITPEKKEAMTRAARRWMIRFGADRFHRLDVVCVAAGRVTAHYKEIECPAKPRHHIQ